MVLRKFICTRFQIVEAHIEGVNAHRLGLILEIGVLERVHNDHIDFAKGVSCLERH